AAVVAAGAAALLAAAPALASGPTLYVSASAASDPSCAAASQANPFATVAAALACATDGATIQLGNGTFAGGFTIAKNVTLRGSGPGTGVCGPYAPVPTLTEVKVGGGRAVALQ